MTNLSSRDVDLIYDALAARARSLRSEVCRDKRRDFPYLTARQRKYLQQTADRMDQLRERLRKGGQ